MTVPLIVDVDTGIDDSLALLYLLASTDAQILGMNWLVEGVQGKITR